jgi:hypothetical protein
MLLSATVIICIIIAIIVNHGVKGIEEKSVKGFYLIFIGFIIQLTIFNRQFASSKLANLMPSLYIISLFILILFLVLNLKYNGIKIALAGFLLNVATIVANKGYMPQDTDKLAAMGEFDKINMLNKFGTYYNGITMSARTHLNFLGDIIAPTFLKPYGSVYSIGDIFILIGICIFIFEFIKFERNQEEIDEEDFIEG